MHTIFKFIVALAISSFFQHSALAGAAADAFSRKDYNEAYRQWSKNPDTAEAKLGIGRILLEGLGGPKDSEKGLSKIKEAASAGYSPAVIYLANYYEKAGAYSRAISYLRRLQAKSKSLSRQEKIVTLLGTLTKKPHSTNQNFCKEVKTLSELGGSADKKITRECALNGLPSSITRTQAEAELKGTLATNPSYNSLKRLAPGALNPESASFDPASVLSALLAVDPTLSKGESKELTITGAVSKSICVKLPTTNTTQKINQLSYCALAALMGDQQLAIISSRAFASGNMGRKSTELALTFAKLAGSPPELNGLQLQMLTETPNKWSEHLEFLSSTAQTLSASDLNAAIRFQSNAASKPVKGYTRVEYAKLLRVSVGNDNIDLEELERVLNARNALPMPTAFAALGGEPEDLASNYELLKKRFSGEKGIRYKLVKTRTSNDLQSFLPLVAELTEVNQTLKQSERIALLEEALSLIERNGITLDAKNAITLGDLFLSVEYDKSTELAPKGYRTAAAVRQQLEQSQGRGTSVNTEATAKLNELIQKITNYLVSPQAVQADEKSNEGEVFSNTRPKPSPKNQAGNALEELDELEEQKIICDRTKLPDICRGVGKTLVKQLQNQRYGLQASDLLDDALSYLRKATEAGDLVAHRYIVDAYEAKQLLSEADRKQSDQSLETLLARGDIGGELRRHLKTINTNAVTQLLTNLGSILTGDRRFSEACSKVRSISQSNQLDDVYDRGLAAAALDSVTCRPRTNQ